MQPDPQNETLAAQERDSEIIFTAVSKGADDLAMAKLMIVTFYVPDPSFSRCGISHALKRLEKFFGEKS